MPSPRRAPTQQSPGAPGTRRERREAARASAARRTRARRTSFLTPVRAVTLLAVVGGAVLVVALMASAQAPATADLRLPATTPAAGLASGRFLGRADAPVSLTIWSDFQCPACGLFTRTVEPRLITDYVLPGTLRIQYRDVAFLGQESIDAAVGARCAAEQDRFWPYHDLLFANQQGENQGAFSRARLRSIASAAGLDTGIYDQCVTRSGVADPVASETNEAHGSGIDSTPTIVVGDEVFQGVPAFAELSASIERHAGIPSPAIPTITP